MKHSNLQPIAAELAESMAEVWSAWRRQKLPLYLLIGLCLNLIVAPAVQAAAGDVLSRNQSYALGILVLATVALAIYLFVVMFQPERF